MQKKHSRPLTRQLGMGLVATLAVLFLMLFSTVSAFANTVNISDKAGILDGSVRSEASALPNRIDIYTVNSFSGVGNAFNQEAVSKIPNSDSIVMAISTNPGHVAIVGGRNVRLSNNQYQDAVNSFINDFKSRRQYPSATVAAIHSLNNSLGGSGLGGIVPGGAGNTFGFGTACCIGLLVLGGIALFAFSRKRRGMFNRGPQMPYNQPYNQPYGQQGGYPPNYGPGNQGGGMNPWAAGGLGAAAGGLLGYELGKEQGERGNEGNQGNQGNFGGGAGGDFGGGGGGGDFGGGAGGDFGGGGGGGDFGGGGGGGDFGGGSGGDF